jgi:hypothetical protein
VEHTTPYRVFMGAKIFLRQGGRGRGGLGGGTPGVGSRPSRAAIQIQLRAHHVDQ